MLHPGLYEQVINNALNRELSEVPEACKSTAPIDTAEASKVLAQYLTEVVQKGLDNVQDNGGGIEAQIELANQIVSIIQTTTKEADFAALGVDRQAEQLLALLWKNDPRLAAGKAAKDIERPETSLAQSSLFTGAIEVVVITQNGEDDSVKTIAKFNPKCGLAAKEYYDHILPDIIKHAIEQVKIYRNLAIRFKSNDSWEPIIKERVLGSLNGTAAYDSLTAADIDKLVLAFQEMSKIINE